MRLVGYPGSEEQRSDQVGMRNEVQSPCQPVCLDPWYIPKAMRKDPGGLESEWPSGAYWYQCPENCTVTHCCHRIFVASWRGHFSCSPLDLWACIWYFYFIAVFKSSPKIHVEITIIWVLNYPCPVLSRWAVFLPSKQWFLRLIAAIISHLVSKETAYPFLLSIPSLPLS